MKKLLKDFFKKLDKTFTLGIVVFIGLILSIITWGHSPKDTLTLTYYSLAWIVLGILLLYLIVFIIIKMYYEFRNPLTYSLPNLKSIVVHEKELIFILDHSELFYQGMMVTLFYNDENDSNLQIKIGIGYVETINNLGYIQIKLSNFFITERSKPIIDSIVKGIINRKNIRIKPSIDYIDINTNIEETEQYGKK